MFVKNKEAMFASATNISKFDVITVRRMPNGFALSAYFVPLQDMDSYHDIAIYPSKHDALPAFDSLMQAIAKTYWSVD